MYKRQEGDHIGIVGGNGVGKTTLLNILSGELIPDEGSVIREVPVSYFKQFRDRAEQVDLQKCRKLGLTGKLSREHLSGGEMTRLGLAAMNKDSLLTFADEPTANLDADGVELCCQMLEQCSTLLLISHDRAVLNRLCTRIVEVRDGCLYFYTGNFAAYHEQREQAFKRQEFEYQQYRSEKSRLEKAARQRSQASKSVRKAPSRMGNSEARLYKREAGEKMEKLDNARKAILSRLEQLEVKEKPREMAQVRIDFSLTDPPANREIVMGDHITFNYGKKLIFENASFSLPKGSKTALIGPNGAGKSTTMNIMTGCMGATQGEVLINGYDILKEPEKAKRYIGYLPEHPPLYMDMTVREYLDFAAELKEIRKSQRREAVDEAEKMVKVQDVEHRLIRNLSKGYRQRVGLAQAILGFPDMIILDDCENEISSVYSAGNLVR